MYSVLLNTDFMYSNILGIKGEFLFRLEMFFAGHFRYKLVYYNLYFGYKFVSKRVQNTYKTIN
jgi:hypothetical protein